MTHLLTKYTSYLENLFEAKYISFFKYSKTAPPYILSTYPKQWLDIYKSKQYYLSDPVLNYNMQPFRLLFWGQSYFGQSDEQSKKIYKSAQKYHIKSGFSVLISDKPQDFWILTLTSLQDELIFKNKILNKQEHIFLLLFIAKTFFELSFDSAQNQTALNNLTTATRHYLNDGIKKKIYPSDDKTYLDHMQ